MYQLLLHSTPETVYDVGTIVSEWIKNNHTSMFTVIYETGHYDVCVNVAKEVTELFIRDINGFAEIKEIIELW